MIQYLQLSCQPVPPSSPLLSVRNKILVINTKNVVFILIMNDVHIQPLNENSKANQANYEYCFTKGKKMIGCSKLTNKASSKNQQSSCDRLYKTIFVVTKDIHQQGFSDVLSDVIVHIAEGFLQ